MFAARGIGCRGCGVCSDGLSIGVRFFPREDFCLSTDCMACSVSAMVRSGAGSAVGFSDAMVGRVFIIPGGVGKSVCISCDASSVMLSGCVTGVAVGADMTDDRGELRSKEGIVPIIVTPSYHHRAKRAGARLSLGGSNSFKCVLRAILCHFFLFASEVMMH